LLVVVYCSDDEDAEVRCKENIDFAIAADPSNAEAYHTLASYWLCKGDRQVIVVTVAICSLCENFSIGYLTIPAFCTFSAFSLVVGWQEGHLACKN